MSCVYMCRGESYLVSLPIYAGFGMEEPRHTLPFWVMESRFSHVSIISDYSGFLNIQDDYTCTWD